MKGQRKCRNCGKVFTKAQPLQQVCGYKCAAQYAAKERLKKVNADWKAQKKVLKEKLMSHKDYFRLLQIVFNTYIRKRDADRPCVSCGTFKAEEFHCGHYIASTYSYLRFNEFNANKQCSKCNTHLRGNSVPYRIELINRIGLQQVEQLENDRHKELKITIPEIKELIKLYKEKIKTTPVRFHIDDIPF